MKRQINALPAPTFRWLKMNGTMLEDTDLPQRTDCMEIDAGEEQTVLLTGAAVQSFALAPRAKLNLVQILSDAGEHPAVQEIHVSCEKDAQLHVFWLFTGGKALYPSCTVDLTGDGSSLEMDAAYVVRTDETLDMNVAANHIGKNTCSRIDVKGVLYGRAKKIFRGTIDLRRGCKGASGDEREEVLLMDDDVINQTIPLILCAEEDVAGNHGASIGRMDEEVQFYLQSRGLSAQETEKILLEARLCSVIGKMPAQVRGYAMQAASLVPQEEDTDK